MHGPYVDPTVAEDDLSKELAVDVCAANAHASVRPFD
jgi:hypothetical protein